MNNKWSFVFCALIAFLFNACGGDSSSSAEDSSNISSSSEMGFDSWCNERFGISETDPWTDSLPGNDFIANHICDELNEYMSLMLAFYARCTSAEYYQGHYNIEIVTEQRYMHIRAKVSNCSYVLESDGDLSPMITNYGEKSLESCICKVENDKVYYRNVIPKISEEESSSSVPESSSSSSLKESSSSVYSSSVQESSSSEESSSSVWIPTVLPEGKYSCKEYDCVATDYLNPDIEYGELLDSRENKIYRTVKIFDQEWMAQNLDYRYVLSETDSNSFCYNDSLEYCKKYGRLYTWAAAIDSVSIEKNGYGICGFQALCNFSEDEKLRGICPEGYRIPNKTDWTTLLESIMTDIEDKGSYAYYHGAATKLRDMKTWEEKDLEATDKFGFSMLSTGLKYQGNYQGIDAYTAFWSLEESPKSGTFAGYYAYTAMNEELIWSNILWHTSEKNSAHPIRCIKE